MTAAEWFSAQLEDIGTHWADCWKTHPDCAYWAGRADGWALDNPRPEMRTPNDEDQP